MPTLMKKANGERLVPDEKVAEYLEMGYSVIAPDGKVLEKPRPTTPAEFAQIIREKDAIIAALAADNAMLKAALADATQRVQTELATDTAENGAYEAEEAADTPDPANSAPETEMPQKGNSVAKKRNAAKDDKEAADKAAE